MSEQFDTGDGVIHIPSGQEWECGFVRDGKLYNNGWPLEATPIDQFTLSFKATTEHRMDILRRMASSSRKSDPRQQYAEQYLRENAT